MKKQDDMWLKNQIEANTFNLIESKKHGLVFGFPFTWKEPNKQTNLRHKKLEESNSSPYLEEKLVCDGWLKLVLFKLIVIG